MKTKLFFVVILSLLFFSCSIQKPSIMSFSHRLVVMPGTNSREEKLSVFLSVFDNDGTNDIEYIYIINDKTELCWTLTENNWIKKNEGKTVWIGSNGLSCPSGIIPRSSYRIILVDKAGERDEKSFVLAATETKNYSLPTVEIKGRYVNIKSKYPNNTVFFLDGGNNVTRTVAVKVGETSLDTLWQNEQWKTKADYITVYGFDPKSEIGFFSWKTRLQD